MINTNSYDGPEPDQDNRWDNRQVFGTADIMAVVREQKQLPQIVTGPNPMRIEAFKVIKNLKGHFLRMAMQREILVRRICRIINSWIVEIMV